MKRFLLWLVGVLLGVVLFLGIVVGYSWFSADTQDLPKDEGIVFADIPLERNGYCWQVPLVGAMADKVLYQSSDLTVQKLGTITDAWPVFTVPEWVDQSQVTLQIRKSENDEVVFNGSLTEYADFRFTQNGEYEVEMQLWRLPNGMERDALAKPTDKIVRSPGLEQPARPAGWYGYRFGFTLAATPQVKLSAEKMRQGDAVAVFVNGLLGDTPPVLKSDLGAVQFQRSDAGWVGYLGAAYNAEARKHTVEVSLGDQVTQVEIAVRERNFGKAPRVVEPEPEEGAQQEFRDVVWPLYKAATGPRKWQVAWDCPVQYNKILMGYGMVQLNEDGSGSSKSNSTVFETTPGTQVITPTAGTVIFADTLKLTGNTVVIDHGCGVRTFLYGLDSIYVSKGDELILNNAVGEAGETLTFDVKIGNKSIDPWELFDGHGGLFAK